MLTIAFLCSCASNTPPEDEEVPSAEGYYQLALDKLAGERSMLFFTDVDYPGAIELLQEVIDNYPYSEYATLAELQIADVHFEQGDYDEAASFYQDFVELHPNHERVPYAIYRNGLCSYELIREPYQDQTPTHDAIAHFRLLLQRYPDSPDAPAAQVALLEAEDRMAQASISVGDFYFRRGEYHASVGRYREALTKYPSHTDHLRTMTRLATSLKRMRRYYEAEQLYLQVLAADPADDAVLDEIYDELGEIEGGVAGDRGQRPLQRSCADTPNPSCDTDDALPY